MRAALVVDGVVVRVVAGVERDAASPTGWVAGGRPWTPPDELGHLVECSDGVAPAHTWRGGRVFDPPAEPVLELDKTATEDLVKLAADRDPVLGELARRALKGG